MDIFGRVGPKFNNMFLSWSIKFLNNLIKDNILMIDMIFEGSYQMWKEGLGNPCKKMP